MPDDADVRLFVLHHAIDIESRLGIKINKTSRVSGGNINRVYCLESVHEKYLLKVNDRQQFPNMFKREQQGLLTIALTKTIAAPEVIVQGETGSESYLLIEWIPVGKITPKASFALGEQLAAMHLHSAEKFGLDHDNYMGSLSQSNKLHRTWARFFIDERLRPMVEMALSNGELNSIDAQQFGQLYQRLPNLFQEESPALIHGDLWSGNYLISDKGRPYLIDPAISYGNREFDIAMTMLFGGFDRAFYEAYDATYPLQTGWQQRINLWNLYPLLVHLNLFGGGYLAQTRACLRQFL